MRNARVSEGRGRYAFGKNVIRSQLRSKGCMKTVSRVLNYQADKIQSDFPPWNMSIVILFDSFPCTPFDTRQNQNVSISKQVIS